MEEKDLPPGGQTSFNTTLRELQLLRRYKMNTLKPSDMLEFGDYTERAAEWFERFCEPPAKPIDPAKRAEALSELARLDGETL